jgi:colicin import membrane protein
MKYPVPLGPARFDNEDLPLKFGMTLSALLHIALAIFVLFGGFGSNNELPEVEIYSVTLEGGRTLGGKSQVPDETKKEKAPPKAAQEPPKKQEEKAALNEEKVKEESVEDAEVSLATPVPAKPTEKPTQKPTAKPTQAPTAKPTSNPTPKATATPKVKALTKEEIDEGYQSALQRYMGESVDAGGEGFGAARVGGEGMGGGVLRSPEWIRYRDALRAHVRSRWAWNDPRANLSAVVSFEISPEGRISNIQLFKSSGNREYDMSCLRAIERSDPVPVPPPSVYQDFKASRITFLPKDLLQ